MALLRRDDLSVTEVGFEVRNGVGCDGMRWITVGPAVQPGASIVLHPPAADSGMSCTDATSPRTREAGPAQQMETR